MIQKLRNEENNELFEAILKLESIEECYMFFEDLCTVKEIESMAIRLHAAKSLLKGETYEKTLENVNISSATLSRVSKAIKYGDGGYKKIIEKCGNK